MGGHAKNRKSGGWRVYPCSQKIALFSLPMSAVEVKNLIEHNVTLFEDRGLVLRMSIVGGDSVFVDVDLSMSRLTESTSAILNHSGVWL